MIIFPLKLSCQAPLQVCLNLPSLRDLFWFLKTPYYFSTSISSSKAVLFLSKHFIVHSLIFLLISLLLQEHLYYFVRYYYYPSHFIYYSFENNLHFLLSTSLVVSLTFVQTLSQQNQWKICSDIFFFTRDNLQYLSSVLLLQSVIFPKSPFIFLLSWVFPLILQPSFHFLLSKLPG